MGAILAILGEAGDPELSERLQRMLARSPYRGEPEFVVEGPLAIGIQSMGWDASLHSAGNWLVAFHGYIGNWVELVPSNGWRFPEDSNNAHKVAISYEILGDALFAKLRGEWAVVIWDRHKKNLLAARDVIGCRPMFRQAFRSRVFFATEVRQVLAGSGAPVEIDIETFRRFLHFEPNRNRSSVCGVHQIPACRLWGSGVDHDGPRSEPFFRFGSEWQQLSGIGVDAAAEVVRDRLETAVTRASAGRPVGVALSGGLDSSTVWGILNNLGSAEADHPDIAAFCLRFPGRAEDEGDYMEAVFADRPGLRTDIRMLSSIVLPRLEEAAERADTPYLANIISQLELARSARADGRRIVLTGHGGDWAFQGNLHDLEHAVLCEREPAAAWWATRFVFGQRMFGRACRRLVRHLARRNPITPPSSERGSEQVTSGGLSAEVRALWGEADDAYGEAGRRSMLEGLAIEQAGWHLTPSEQVSAAFGVEIRHPLLDLDLLEGALSVAQKLHLARGFHKGLLRMAAAPVLPEKVCSRKGEIGLSGFLIDGLSPVAREHPGVNCALRESTRFMGGLSGIAVGFGDEFVVPLRLLIDDLTRRGQLPDYRGMEE